MVLGSGLLLALLCTASGARAFEFDVDPPACAWAIFLHIPKTVRCCFGVLAEHLLPPKSARMLAEELAPCVWHDSVPMHK